MKNILSFLTIAVIGGTLSGQANAVQILINPSFETPVFAPGFGLSPSIPGWIATGGSGLLEIGAAGLYGVTGHDGIQVMELDSTGNVTAGTTTPIPGGIYELSFLYARRIVGGPSIASNTFDVLWNGGLVASFSPTTGAMTLYSTTLTAAGGDTLEFRGTGTSDSLGALIDNVQLNTVPDGGSTVALLGLALGGITALRRKLKVS